MATLSSAGMAGGGETPGDALVTRVTILRHGLSRVSLDPCSYLCLLQPLFPANTCACGHVCVCACAREITHEETRSSSLCHLPPLSVPLPLSLLSALSLAPSVSLVSPAPSAPAHSFQEFISRFVFSVCSPLVSAKTWSPWYQLWHKLQLFTDFSRDNLVTQFHSQISTFVPIAWHKQSHTGHSFKGIPEQRSCSKKWGVGQSGHEQIHSNPTYNSSLGKAQEELSHPRTSDNKRIVLGRDAQDIHPSASLLTPSRWPRFLSITLIPKGDREPQTVT